MNYNGKKVAITGRGGFIAEALYRAIKSAGAIVEWLDGDVRDSDTFEGYGAEIDYTCDYLFHFAAPSSQVLFQRNPAHCIEVTLKGLMNAAQACQKHGIRLIYPSTGLLSSGKFNEYAMCKKISEDYVKGLDIDALGIRIFATYGPGEGHKSDYASVPYLFARDMAEGKSPVVFGDGTQVRDFIYIEDTVQAILHLAEECYDDIVDVGSGDPISFNDILEILRNVSGNGYEKKLTNSPVGYVEKTLADPTRMHDFYVPQVSFSEGIRLTYESIKEAENG